MPIQYLFVEPCIRRCYSQVTPCIECLFSEVYDIVIAYFWKLRASVILFLKGIITVYRQKLPIPCTWTVSQGSQFPNQLASFFLSILFLDFYVFKYLFCEVPSFLNFFVLIIPTMQWFIKCGYFKREDSLLHPSFSRIFNKHAILFNQLW